MAREQNIADAGQYFTGEDKSLVCQIYQNNTSAAPQDISGWGLSWMVKRRKTDSDAAAKITKTTSGGGIVLTTPANGICTVTVTDTDIAGIIGGELYYHELKRTDANAETVLIYGSFVLKQAVHE